MQMYLPVRVGSLTKQRRAKSLHFMLASCKSRSYSRKSYVINSQ